MNSITPASCILYLFRYAVTIEFQEIVSSSVISCWTHHVLHLQQHHVSHTCQSSIWQRKCYIPRQISQSWSELTCLDATNLVGQ